MGSPATEEKRQESEGPQRQVQIEEFYMGQYVVTQEQWQVVASFPKVSLDLQINPSRFRGNRRPVESVSWEMAREFCARLSRESGRQYRLPSEAEWEYACRAETTTPFHYGETLTEQLANFAASSPYAAAPAGQSPTSTVEVGQYPANRFGLYDMHGNVGEWCEDIFFESYAGAPSDGTPRTDEASDLRVMRGGAWYFFPEVCRSAYRNSLQQDYRNPYYGFRLACSVA